MGGWDVLVAAFPCGVSEFGVYWQHIEVAEEGGDEDGEGTQDLCVEEMG